MIPTGGFHIRPNGLPLRPVPPRHSHCHQKHLAHGRLESGWFEKEDSDLPAGGEEHVQADALLTGLPVTTAILPVADRIGLLKRPPFPWGSVAYRQESKLLIVAALPFLSCLVFCRGPVRSSREFSECSTTLCLC